MYTFYVVKNTAGEYLTRRMTWSAEIRLAYFMLDTYDAFEYAERYSGTVFEVNMSVSNSPIHPR